jgi:predicted transcriptional regulator
MVKDGGIKIRVPVAMKAALKKLADARMTSESEIAREALLAYLAARGITADQLRETNSTPAETGAQVVAVVAKEVGYRKRRKASK